ncbi:GxxExxY protein [bacterium]|nr:GxxExxY protein [bacterium]
MKKEIYKQEGYDLVGAAFEVYNQQGHGLAEEIYQESLELELAQRRIPFESKVGLEVFYKGRTLKCRYIPDLLLHKGIVVELKAVSALTEEHEGQLMNYMRISKYSVGYLINFGPAGGLQWKRIILSEFISDD